MEHIFESRRDASLAAASHIAAALQNELLGSTTASMVVTGGSSPAACYDALSETSLAWERVNVWPSDERWVSPAHGDSNERMIRDSLLRRRAAEAHFHGLYDDALDIDERCRQISEAMRRTERLFTCTLLGVGADGHIASLFADAENFCDAVDIDSRAFCVPVITAASPHPRVSLTLAALLRSTEIILLFFGDEKRAVYEQARKCPDAYPVSRLLHQTGVPVTVFWAP